ncbi:hypothetical protein ANCCAN_06805 [Ancylostoma caninum]|uniref:Uncharacterized protein n=1 Tax=Ancylostoma caninum TaxID=29170 RepID=A0A368GW38_ANCCA|nr:hypothetical protein ANCCAN_06805 [Ancylostoma caninum]
MLKPKSLLQGGQDACRRLVCKEMPKDLCWETNA